MEYSHPVQLAAQEPPALAVRSLINKGAALATPITLSHADAASLLSVFHGILKPALYSLEHPDDDNVPIEAGDIVVRAAAGSSRAPLPSFSSPGGGGASALASVAPSASEVPVPTPPPRRQPTVEATFGGALSPGRAVAFSSSPQTHGASPVCGHAAVQCQIVADTHESAMSCSL
jgi:hypothetical protein